MTRSVRYKQMMEDKKRCCSFMTMTYGSKLSSAKFKILRAILLKDGYMSVPTVNAANSVLINTGAVHDNAANIVLINTCTVRGNAESKARNLFESLH
uniref:MTTase N-terminal domain-containing protein n=1 Tax=Peronospora matthiolae TaxID=2874970 RepID=A0AAV1UM22_9STRA